jgi:glutaredoxin
MLKFTNFATTVSIVLLVLTTACSSSKQSPGTDSASKSSDLTAAPGQASSSATSTKLGLASHLKQTGAKFYGTYWCPYCTKQKELFGQQAFSQINYIECDPQGKNAQLELCEKANVTSFPTWEIKGQQYKGMQSLEELAELSDYKGDRQFQD